MGHAFPDELFSAMNFSLIAALYMPLILTGSVLMTLIFLAVL